MREVYGSVLERLLVAHYDGESEEHKSQTFVNSEDSVNVLPPPWPACGDDDGPKRGPKNVTELAEGVVKFEWKLARASLDLSVCLLQDNSRY